MGWLDLSHCREWILQEGLGHYVTKAVAWSHCGSLIFCNALKCRLYNKKPRVAGGC